MHETYLAEFAEPTGYLDFARFGPPSRAVAAVTARLTDAAVRSGPGTVTALMDHEARARAAAARLSGADVERVVLMPNTSTGIAQAASGIAGRVLVPAADFPANTYPWSRADRGPVDWLTARPTPDAVAAALRPDTTAVAVSAVDFRTGWPADLAALREVVGDRLLVVDGIQGFGAVESAWDAADVLVVGGQKWLRAGWSTGFAVLSPTALERIAPRFASWRGAHEHMVFDNTVHPPAADAESWLLTNPNPIAAAALAEALELVESAGVGAIASRIAERVGELADAVQSAGLPIVDRGPTILTFTAPDIPATAKALSDAGIAASPRTDHIRLSPHASTTPASVEALRASLSPARAAKR
ncbi:aminotransferase class V-fold PLP-dependent enzyme [Actinokineospora guangxiensis]|uniref:Aminotransferase class V-fold PLP-dependent enzyme n=1 Tax=Actinokineospora guangxiensis TaxID=1490288 RepID=A0ABW0EVP8_9PSEU